MNIIAVINSLDDLVCLNPATESQIFIAENELSLKFADEYKVYLKEFGAISAKGIELTGIVDSERLNVVDTTKREQILNNNLPQNMYVIENVAVDGNIVLQSETGEIYLLTPTTKPVKISNSLCEYIKRRYYCESDIS